ncbi:tset complex member tsta [Anaeramoeba ignava]|uniref:Tset complex member tsta n=1 Tax=Anaeramoeba ignava TaxID=1746090 RepID=A0A9Q0L9C0_ANAIG|nr:tset complex member tsta [Anaeramoeba ignava]
MESFENNLLEDLLKGDSTKKINAINILSQLICEGRDISPLFKHIIENCLLDENSHRITKLTIYNLIRKISTTSNLILSQYWLKIAQALFRDIQNPDYEISISSIRIIPYIPNDIITQKMEQFNQHLVNILETSNQDLVLSSTIETLSFLIINKFEMIQKFPKQFIKKILKLSISFLLDQREIISLSAFKFIRNIFIEIIRAKPFEYNLPIEKKKIWDSNMLVISKYLSQQMFLNLDKIMRRYQSFQTSDRFICIYPIIIAAVQPFDPEIFQSNQIDTQKSTEELNKIIDENPNIQDQNESNESILKINQEDIQQKIDQIMNNIIIPEMLWFDNQVLFEICQILLMITIFNPNIIKFSWIKIITQNLLFLLEKFPSYFADGIILEILIELLPLLSNDMQMKVVEKLPEFIKSIKERKTRIKMIIKISKELIQISTTKIDSENSEKSQKIFISNFLQHKTMTQILKDNESSIREEIAYCISKVMILRLISEKYNMLELFQQEINPKEDFKSEEVIDFNLNQESQVKVSKDFQIFSFSDSNIVKTKEQIDKETEIKARLRKEIEKEILVGLQIVINLDCGTWVCKSGSLAINQVFELGLFLMKLIAILDLKNKTILHKKQRFLKRMNRSLKSIHYLSTRLNCLTLLVVFFDINSQENEANNNNSDEKKQITKRDNYSSIIFISLKEEMLNILSQKEQIENWLSKNDIGFKGLVDLNQKQKIVKRSQNENQNENENENQNQNQNQNENENKNQNENQPQEKSKESKEKTNFEEPINFPKYDFREYFFEDEMGNENIGAKMDLFTTLLNLLFLLIEKYPILSSDIFNLMNEIIQIAEKKHDYMLKELISSGNQVQQMISKQDKIETENKKQIYNNIIKLVKFIKFKVNYPEAQKIKNVSQKFLVSKSGEFSNLLSSFQNRAYELFANNFNFSAKEQTLQNQSKEQEEFEGLEYSNQWRKFFEWKKFNEDNYECSEQILVSGSSDPIRVFAFHEFIKNEKRIDLHLQVKNITSSDIDNLLLSIHTQGKIYPLNQKENSVEIQIKKLLKKENYFATIPLQINALGVNKIYMYLHFNAKQRQSIKLEPRNFQNILLNPFTIQIEELIQPLNLSKFTWNETWQDLEFISTISGLIQTENWSLEQLLNAFQKKSFCLVFQIGEFTEETSIQFAFSSVSLFDDLIFWVINGMRRNGKFLFKVEFRTNNPKVLKSISKNKQIWIQTISNEPIEFFHQF